MAGTNPSFDPAAFRDAIRFAMTMGTPNSTNDVATFRWNVLRTYGVQDSAGNPFDWTETATTTNDPLDVQVPVAIQFVSGVGTTTDTSMGQFDASRIVVTVLDEDYALLTQDGRFADLIVSGETTYKINFVEPPVGLFGVDVWSIHAQAEDES